MIPKKEESSQKIKQFVAEERISQNVADALEVLNNEGYIVRLSVFNSDNNIRKTFLQVTEVVQQIKNGNRWEVVKKPEKKEEVQTDLFGEIISKIP